MLTKKTNEEEDNFAFVVKEEYTSIDGKFGSAARDKLVLTVSLIDGPLQTKGFWNISTSSETAQDAIVERIVSVTPEVIDNNTGVRYDQILIAIWSGSKWVRASKPLSSDGSVGLNEEDFGTLGKVLSDLKKQIKAIKGTGLWSDRQDKSIDGLFKQVNSVIVGNSGIVKWEMSNADPSVLSVTGKVNIKLFGKEERSFIVDNLKDITNAFSGGKLLYYDMSVTDSGSNPPNPLKIIDADNTRFR